LGKKRRQFFFLQFAHDNYDKSDKKLKNKTPSDCDNKAFTSCLVHGPKSKHTSKECYKNPKNGKHQPQDKQRHYKAHHNNACYTSNDDKSRLSTDTMVPSEDLASASSESKKIHKDENYHLHVAKKMKAGSHVPRKSDHQQQRTKSQSSQKGKKGEVPPTFLDNDLNFMDTILMGLSIPWMQTLTGLMMSRIRSILTCDGPHQWNL
jgi:hypothetical protein